MVSYGCHPMWGISYLTYTAPLPPARPAVDVLVHRAPPPAPLLAAPAAASPEFCARSDREPPVGTPLLANPAPAPDTAVLVPVIVLVTPFGPVRDAPPPEPSTPVE
jgi:hypothetical protein